MSTVLHLGGKGLGAGEPGSSAGLLELISAEPSPAQDHRALSGPCCDSWGQQGSLPCVLEECLDLTHAWKAEARRTPRNSPRAAVGPPAAAHSLGPGVGRLPWRLDGVKYGTGLKCRPRRVCVGISYS